MKNKTLRNVKLFIALVLVLLSSMVAGSILGKVDELKMIWELGMRVVRHSDAGFFAVYMEPAVSGTKTRAVAEGVEFTEITSMGVLLVRGKDNEAHASWWFFLLYLLFVSALVTFVVMLVGFACKLPRGRILTRANVRMVRWMGVSLLVVGLSFFFLTAVEYVWIEDNVVLDGYRVAPPSLHPTLLLGMIFCTLAEIMNLAGRLQREQELTI